MHILILIDSYLIDKYERFSHWVQKLCGLTCFDLARICPYVIIFYPYYLYCNYTKIGLSTLCFELGFKLLFVRFAVRIGGIKSDIDEAEKQALSSMEMGFKNPLASGEPEAMNRITTFLLSFMAINLLDLFFSAKLVTGTTLWASLFYTAIHYFIACTPLPPNKSKARKLLESIKTKLSLTPSPLPTPS